MAEGTQTLNPPLTLIAAHVSNATVRANQNFCAHTSRMNHIARDKTLCKRSMLHLERDRCAQTGTLRSPRSILSAVSAARPDR
eukprot:3527913-Pleurochrysis_carterae.AAC.2